MTEPDDVDAAGRRLAAARAEASAAFEHARTVGLQALAAGVPETSVARRLGVDRMTVRKWEGKR